MRRHRILAVLLMSLTVGACPIISGEQPDQAEDAVIAKLTNHEYDLESAGREFLLNEAKNSDFFLLGELHGENEIPALLEVLWPRMWESGYRHIAAEVSPWAAYQLELVPDGKGPEIQGLWTKEEAKKVHALAAPNANVLWGCDMEEAQPQIIIQRLAALNPGDQNLKRMAALTRDGYSRKMAPELLELVNGMKGSKDEVVNDVSLRQNLLATLEIEKNRLSPDTRMMAQNERELLMKEQFLAHFRRSATPGIPSKVLLRFGRNHLHRGYDARGISTLGNFIAEFTIAQGKKAFNVGAFGAGGTERLLGNAFNADERMDELTFALLAEKAKYSATVYDLRPIRPSLHRIPEKQRSTLEKNLIYWADSYDALLCYKIVTPLKQK